MSDRDYMADWLSYWESFCAHLAPSKSHLSCKPKPARALDLEPRGSSSHITVRCAIHRGRVVTDFTLRGPKAESNRNFDRIHGKYGSTYSDLEWDKTPSGSESHIRAVRLCNPNAAGDRKNQHKWIMEQAELFRDWMIEFGI